MDRNLLTLRFDLNHGDNKRIREITESVGVFNPEEINIDLYWIVICSELRGKGIGKRLIIETEKTIMERGGKKIYVETSSKASYYDTRQFYIRCGYMKQYLKTFMMTGMIKSSI